MIQVPEELELIDRNPLRVCELAASFLLDWGVVPTVTLNRSYEARVDEAEVRLGFFSLPLALRWLFLSHIGSEHPVVGRQDPLVSAENLEVDDDGVIAYRMEKTKKNSARWGFRVDGQANSDPPVVWKRAGRAGRWRAYTDRLSIDLLELTLSESMLISGGNLLHVEGPLDGLVTLKGYCRWIFQAIYFFGRFLMGLLLDGMRGVIALFATMVAPGIGFFSVVRGRRCRVLRL